MRAASSLLLVAFFVAACAKPASTPLTPEQKKAAAKEQAEKILRAFVRGDYEAFDGYLYPNLDNLPDAKRDRIDRVKKMAESVASQGYVLRSATLGEPEQLLSEDGIDFAIIPESIEMECQQGVVTMKSFLLAISEDHGHVWTFVDGDGLEKDTRLIKLPPALVLPAHERPVLNPTSHPAPPGPSTLPSPGE